jgi:hypothetical protein
MNLPLALLIPGLLLIALGAPLALCSAWAGAQLRAFPRSRTAEAFCFGGAALWFLIDVWHLSPSDHGEYHVPLCVAFGVLAVMVPRYAPDFLAVRGLAVLVLLGAMPLLMAGYMNFDAPRIYFQKALLYVCVALAIWLGAQPWRLRDFIGWLFTGGRARRCGCLLLIYGAGLCVIAGAPGTIAK